jgi:hypothetical protein
MSNLPPLPTKASTENARWITANFAVLSERYPNRWIAVDKERVLAADRDLSIVRRSAAEQARPEDVMFHFIDDGSLIFSLS